MKTLFARYALMLAVLTSFAPFGTPAWAQEVSQAAPSPAAKEFGAIYVPIDLTVEASVIGFKKSFELTVRDNPGIAQLEKSKPGVIAAASAAGQKAVSNVLRRTVPDIQKKLAAFGAASFTEAELSEINAYYSTDAGARIQRLVAENVNVSALVENMKRTGNIPDLSGKDLIDSVDSKVVTKISDDDLLGLMKFNTTVGGRKLSMLAVPLADLVATEMNQAVNASMPEIQQAVFAAISAHMGKTPRKAAP
ncbi:MAG: DUF2059 domain-containing protein [Sphingopyxis sp.]|nr:DUF2059 domain-containing protein [Sphingopyxis sp.]